MTFRLRRAAALLALYAFASVIGLSAADGHSGFGDDRACGDVTLFVSAAPISVASATPVTIPQHCALCHLQRAASGASPIVLASLGWALAPIATAPAERPAATAARTTSVRASRAPPTTSLS